MTYPQYDVRLPDSPYGAWGPEAPAAAAARPPASRGFRWVGTRLLVLITGGMVAIVVRSFLYGLDDPAVGDCAMATGATRFELVDCVSPEAQFRIVGEEEAHWTEAEFTADPGVCAGFATWDVALWNPIERTEYGKVYCAEQL